MEPPADAEEQSDGSRIATLPDGATLRYTQRPDGEYAGYQSTSASPTSDAFCLRLHTGQSFQCPAKLRQMHARERTVSYTDRGGVWE
jgi:hypothetical protein